VLPALLLVGVFRKDRVQGGKRTPFIWGTGCASHRLQNPDREANLAGLSRLNSFLFLHEGFHRMLHARALTPYKHRQFALFLLSIPFLLASTTLSLQSAYLFIIMFTIKAFIAFALLAASANAVRLGWDSTYDNADQSLDVVACSDGDHGLERLGYDTFGSLPTFPYIGAADSIEGWNSEKCGNCYQLTYHSKSVYMLAIDVAGDGYNLSQQGMDDLTNGHAEEYGEVQVTAQQVAASFCGL